VECWGYNANGELGNGTTAGSSTPVAVSGLPAATGVAAGGSFTCAVLSSGAVSCWGANSWGQLGNDGSTDSPIPVLVAGLEGNSSLAGLNGGALGAGAGTACVSPNGAVRCWGFNGFGQLGNGTQSSRSPVPVAVDVPLVTASSIDRVNYPGLGGTNPGATTTSRLAFGNFLSQGETFVAGRTGPLQGVGVALDTSDLCASYPSSHVFVHVFSVAASSSRVGSSNFTDLDVIAASCATWAGGYAGSLLYVPSTTQPVLIAGNTYGIYVTSDNCPSGSECLPGLVYGTFTNNDGFQGQAAGVSLTPDPGTDFSNDAGSYTASSSGIDLVFATVMGDSWGFANDTDPRLRYAGASWGYYPGRPASFEDAQNDVHATLNDGDSVTFTFTGSGVTYISELSDGYGLVDVYLDGQLVQTVDANAPGSGQPLDGVAFSALHNSGGHALFSAAGLTPGQHTIQLVKRSGVYMLVDGFVVQP
jgi:hypothetical protein